MELQNLVSESIRTSQAILPASGSMRIYALHFADLCVTFYIALREEIKSNDGTTEPRQREY